MGSSDYEQSDSAWPDVWASHPGSSIDGPATVVNPEQRRRKEESSIVSTQGSSSNLFNLLFPSESTLEEAPPDFGLDDVRLQHFRLEERIGRGGMGAVFRGVDERLDRVVALKVLAPAFARDPATVERFRNEAKAAARLDHENISRVYYTGEDRGVPFIAFEFVTGTNLRQLIQQRGRLDPDEAINYTLQIAAALRHTDAAGVVHRDIKPSNIIITPAGRAKLVDLGLARKAYTEAAPELTMAGTTLGTFDYISPEQAKDPRNVDVRSDIYSLGCTLYHMLTGEAPYPEGTFFKKLLDRQDKTPPDPTQKAPNLLPELGAVVQKMMAGQPRLRYRNADELLNDLMLIAGRLGLRGIHPDGLVWASAARLNRSRFWERHLGWIVTAAALLAIVVVIERSSRDSTVLDRTEQNAPSGRDQTTGKTGEPDAGQSPDVASKRNNPDREKPENGSDGPEMPLSEHELPEAMRQAFAVGVGQPWTTLLGTRESPAKVNGGTRSPDRPDDSENGGSNSGGGMGNLQETASQAISVQPQEEGAPAKSYPNLEAACEAARSGDVVLLSFNGVRTDDAGREVAEKKPIRISNKTLTIRAATGYRPVVLFAGNTQYGTDPQLRMITISNGNLSMSNVGVVVAVNEAIEIAGNSRWAAFSLQGSDSLNLSSVHVTLDNPRSRPASVVEVRPRSDTAAMKEMNGGGGVADVFDVSISNSFFRGEGDWMTVLQSRPGRLQMRNSALAVDGAVVAVDGNADPDSTTASDRDRFDVELRHVTAITGRSVLQINASGTQTRTIVPLKFVARDNLFGARGNLPGMQADHAFVSMTGDQEVAAFRSLLQWKGDNNFIDGFKYMWTVAVDDPFLPPPPPPMEFDEWRKHWNMNQDRKGGVIWQQEWSAKTASKAIVDDLRIDPETDRSSNPAYYEATDGSAVGAKFLKVADPNAPPPRSAAEPRE